MDSFSWSDSFRATLGSCLPCLSRGIDSDDEVDQQSGRGGPRSARDELERLLDEPMTDHEAETMSLHSNIGGARRKKKTKRTHKRIRILGVDLFGRRPVPAEEDEEGGEEPTTGSRPRTISTSTLDSDAAPLADDAINDFTTRAQRRWAPGVTDEQLAAEEEAERGRLETEERRTRHAERRELKRLAEMGIFNNHQNSDEFEGFVGSGSGVSPIADEFGPFVGSQASKLSAQSEQEDEGIADFDAVAYTMKRGTGQNGSPHSRKHSRTSASLSTEEDRRRTQASSTPVPPSNFEGQRTPVSKASKSKQRKSDTLSASSATKSGSSNRSKPSHGSTPSTSLQSPSVPPSPSVRSRAQPEAEFEGIPGGRFTARDLLPPSATTSSFPSTGFGGSRRPNSGLGASAGVALANRGDA